MSTEVGHHYGRVYLSQDGELVVPLGAEIIHGNIDISTGKGGNLPKYGISVINSTDVGVFVLAQPTKGAKKTVIWGSTSQAWTKTKLRVETGDGTMDVKIRGLAAAGAVCVFPSSEGMRQMKARKYGMHPAITMIGLSTFQWMVAGLSFGETTGLYPAWTFATST